MVHIMIYKKVHNILHTIWHKLMLFWQFAVLIMEQIAFSYFLNKESFCQNIHNSSSCVKRYFKNPSRQTLTHAHKQTNRTS